MRVVINVWSSGRTERVGGLIERAKRAVKIVSRRRWATGGKSLQI